MRLVLEAGVGVGDFQIAVDAIGVGVVGEQTILNQTGRSMTASGITEVRNQTLRNRSYGVAAACLATPEGWLYLAVFIDLYSRKVVGWSMGERMTSNLVCDALKMAWFRCKRPSGVIVHTDRGSQYCSNDFQRLLRQYGMRSSMSRKADCWDNAVAESFFHSFKVEAVQGEEFPPRQDSCRICCSHI